MNQSFTASLHGLRNVPCIYLNPKEDNFISKRACDCHAGGIVKPSKQSTQEPLGETKLCNITSRFEKCAYLVHTSIPRKSTSFLRVHGTVMLVDDCHAGGLTKRSKYGTQESLGELKLYSIVSRFEKWAHLVYNSSIEQNMSN